MRLERRVFERSSARRMDADPHYQKYRFAPVPVRVNASGTETAKVCAGGFNSMLWTVFVILLVLWLLGLVTSYTFGGFIHILLVIAIAVALIQIISGRRAI